jgi:multidrug resistance efflux pump
MTDEDCCEHCCNHAEELDQLETLYRAVDQLRQDLALAHDEIKGQRSEIAAVRSVLARAREALRRAGERTHSALGGRHAFFTFEATDTVEACPEYECVEARRALLAPPDKETTNG